MFFTTKFHHLQACFSIYGSLVCLYGCSSNLNPNLYSYNLRSSEYKYVQIAQHFSSVKHEIFKLEQIVKFYSSQVQFFLSFCIAIFLKIKRKVPGEFRYRNSLIEKRGKIVVIRDLGKTKAFFRINFRQPSRLFLY